LTFSVLGCIIDVVGSRFTVRDMSVFILLSVLASIHLSFSPLDLERREGRHPSLKGGVPRPAGVGKPAILGYLIHLKTGNNPDIKVHYRNPLYLGKYDIPPLYPPTILSQKQVPHLERDIKVYGSNTEYPGKGFERLEWHREGSSAIIIYPLQYRPKDKSLILYQDIEIEGAISLLDKRDILSLDCSKFNQSGYEYLIITNEHFAPYFEPLAEWKTKKGVRTNIATTEAIYASQEGRDNQEKIREFIKTQWQDSGVVWVLLGGDVGIVPSRVAFAFESGGGIRPDEDSLHCDLYYSDLDGCWNFDGDGIFGEVEDSIDIMPDVFVGRAPVNSISDVENFVRKVLIYEKTPPLNYLTDALFFAQVLWGSPGSPDYTDGGVHKDMIAVQFMPPHFDITKLYQRDGQGSAAGVIDTINQGRHIKNHSGHGWIHLLGMKPGNISNAAMAGLTNSDKLGILYSIGCWTGAFDYDCVGEHFIHSRGGGGVAYIGNSRYGWGSPGNPGFGHSEIFDDRFFEAIFIDSIVNIGAAFAVSKAYYAPLSGWGNVFRWCQYTLNLFGDPEMPIWTDTPQEVIVTFPDSIPLGQFILYVQVFSTQADPIEGARVTFSGDDYQRGITDPSGQVTLSVSTTSPNYAWLTVTGMNILPYQDSIFIYTDGHHLSLYNHYTEEEINPDDTVRLFAVVKNFGSASSDLTEVTLSTDDTLITITNSVDTVAPLTPSELCTLQFEILVSENALNGHTIRFSLSNIGEWTELVRTPILVITGVTKDGPVSVGDSGTVLLTLKNTGYGIAESVEITVSSLDILLWFTESEAVIDSITANSSVTVPFGFQVSSDCPTPHIVSCIAQFGSVIDTFVIAIACYGLWDDFEGVNNWHSTGDWNIDTYRSYSPSQAFYSGDTISREYRVNAYDSLVSPPFYIDANSTLSFWHWFDMVALEDLAYPGCDGLLIGIIEPDTFHLLDFIGSGGALDSALNSVPFWHKSSYNLSFIPPGREVRVLFKFISNGSLSGEGWYLDDISVQPTYLGLQEREPGFLLFQNYPNPFREKTVISYRLSVIGENRDPITDHRLPITLFIYDLAGRLVRTLPITDHRSPITELTWDGRDDDGKPLPGGVYFYRLQVGNQSATKKLILLR